MKLENHEHTWEKVNWTKSDLLPETVTALGLVNSRYPINRWRKDEICRDCNGIALVTRDGSTLRAALANNFPPFRETPDGPVTGVVIDFEEITEKEERAFR